MDTQSAEVDAAEEMEEPEEVPKDHDRSKVCVRPSASDMGSDEPMAVSGENGGPIRAEPEVVRSHRADLAAGGCTTNSHSKRRGC